MKARIDLSLKYICLLVITLIAISGIHTARGLYADGSFFLLSILNKGWFIADEAARSNAQILSQLPVVLLLKLGINDLNFLIRSYSVGLIFIPLFFWFVALGLHLKSHLFWLLTIAFSSTYLSSGFFAIGEYNFVCALSALSVAILLAKRITITKAVTLTIASFTAMRCYEAMVFMGPLLAVFTAYRLFAKNASPFIIASLSSTCIFFVISFFIALQSILYPHSPGNLSGALNFQLLFKNNQFIYLIFMMVLCFLAFFVRSKLFILVIAALSGVTSIYFFFVQSFWNIPAQYYEFRTVSSLFLFLILAISMATEITTKSFDSSKTITKPSFVICSFLLFCTLSYVTLHHTFGFLKWAKKYEILSSQNSGLVPINLIGTRSILDAGNKFNWPWANPTLSILLRGSADAIILNQSNYSGWEPFDPKTINPAMLSRFIKDKYLY